MGNNCYNYGNDIVTNTFAQPGRRDFDQGSGLCKHSDRPCMQNTCEDVKKGAIADGLTWVGTELPIDLPEVGHYVSLHIWPNSNFPGSAWMQTRSGVTSQVDLL